MSEISIPISRIKKWSNKTTDRSKDTVIQNPIDLIIKPTVACNFKCTFCSSTYLSDNKKDELSLVDIERFLDHYPNTRTIIINGGDPLMMPNEYYFKIIKMLEDRRMYDTVISFTSNLWLFYLNPDKYIDLFTHPQVSCCTSFQFGSGRLKHDLTPFTVDEFWKLSDLFLEKIGYRLSFISVISKENRDTVLDTVKLARDMNVVCKINYLNASGKTTQFKSVTMGSENEMYTQADMYEQYIEIYDNDLWMHEYNTIQWMRILNNLNTTCPLSRSCGKGIRVLQPDGGYYSCGAFGDDREYAIDYNQEMQSNLVIDPLEKEELLSMHDGCFSCPLFNICNGCKKTISDTKRLGLVEYHCSKMHEIMPRLLSIARKEKSNMLAADYRYDGVDSLTDGSRGTNGIKFVINRELQQSRQRLERLGCN